MKKIWRNMKYEGMFELSPYIRAGPRGKLGIFLSPRNMKTFMKKIWRKYRNYEGYMKKYKGNMKYMGKMKKYTENKDFPYISAVGLGKIPSSSRYLWARRGWGGGGSQFPDLGVPQRKDMTHVRNPSERTGSVCGYAVYRAALRGWETID